MAEVKLFKKQVEYQNKDGEDKTATNFFVQCGDVMVPVEVKYFENKDTGRDDRYRERKVLMSAFAEELPEKGNGKKNSIKGKARENAQSGNYTPPDDDSDIPF